MRPRRRDAGRGRLVAEHYHRRSISARLDGPDLTAGLPALDPEEQAFVEELLAQLERGPGKRTDRQPPAAAAAGSEYAGRAGPGALVEIITARYGPVEDWHPDDDEGLRVVE